MKICSTGGQPLDIVVEPSSRLIFWSTLENGISSASMDGTNKQIIVDRGIECVTGLAIDYPTNRLYWADHRKGTIETVLFSGKSRHVITQFRNRSMNLFKDGLMQLLIFSIFFFTSNATKTSSSIRRFSLYNII